MRWFRLAGIPPGERLAALRLQVEAWRPFEAAAARLILAGDEGLAIAWDGQAAQEQSLIAGLAPERCRFIPETLLQAGRDDGVRLLRCVEGFEAQRWESGWLRASRWWMTPLTARDWREFGHASGASADADDHLVPEPEDPVPLASAWAKHYSLQASGDSAMGLERRVVFAGALAMVLASGTLAHQFWDVRQHERSLARQIEVAKMAAAPVLQARDAAMSAVDQVEKLAVWFAPPQPIDVIGYLDDALSKSGVQIKGLDLEGDKLRLGLQLSPNSTRAAIVRDLQAGGRFNDVTEVRAENARGLLTMEMRVVSAPMPWTGQEPQANDSASATVAPPAAAPTPSIATLTPASPPVQAPTPTPTPKAQSQPRPPPGPPKPIIAKPDANGMPPPEVFNAIPDR